MTRNSTGVGNWVLFPWFEEHGHALVHPDDIEPFRSLRPYGRVFRVVGEEAGYSVLLYGEETFRVKDDLISEIDAPPFVFGQRVALVGRNTFATVVEIHWHFKQRRPFFIVAIAGRRMKRRYWAEDLAKANGQIDQSQID